ncbi:MAG: DUF177 domain-containing protein [Clostridia bacterium]|nr:DUF177 domain-containing protein [Clostridia bacterium]
MGGLILKLNLREIIDVPGGRVPFSINLDISHLIFPSVVRYLNTPNAEGEVRNNAGILTINGKLTAEMVCRCDRCGAEFPSSKTTEISALITREEDPEAPEAFQLDGDFLDLDDMLETALILDMETKFLCSEDCKGLCPDCGKNLNEGPCGCRKQTDPRLAVLEQLLDKEQ